MADRSNARISTGNVIAMALVALWLIMAAFPFLWTILGSFKVQSDFFPKADWTYALTGTRTQIETGAAFMLNGYEGAWI